MCYFTPSKKQGRRNFWANGLIGPPKFYHYQKKRKKTDQMWLFYDWPKKVTCILTPLQRWNKKCLAYYLIYEIYNNVAKAFLKLHLNSNNPTISRNFYWNSTPDPRIMRIHLVRYSTSAMPGKTTSNIHLAWIYSTSAKLDFY